MTEPASIWNSPYPNCRSFSVKKYLRRQVISCKSSENQILTVFKQEVGLIAKKRSEFEHKLNARGSKPSDYARYAEYEINLDSLRLKRVKRLGIKSKNHSGARRIFFIFDRATRKFHGDIKLWMQYIEFARKQKSSKKLSEIITNVLRLHPTKPELWIYAANHVMEQSHDIIAARSYMQRGLRFCRESKQLWLEYAKLEMAYVANIAVRGKVLGMNKVRATEKVLSETDGEYNHEFANPETIPPDTNSNFQAIEFIDGSVLKSLEVLPVVSGAIPIAIFDAAMKQFGEDVTIGEEFFDVIAQFHEVPHTGKILQHITTSLLNTASSSLAALSCFIRQPLVCIEVASPQFPGALGLAIDRLNSTMQGSTLFGGLKEDLSSRSLLGQRIMKYMLSLISDSLDPDITKAIAVTLKRLWNQYRLDIEQVAGSNSGPFIDIFTNLQEKGFADMVNPSKPLAMRLWPDDPKIQSLLGEVSTSC